MENIEKKIQPQDQIRAESFDPIIVMKFGGTSVGDARAIESVTRILATYSTSEVGIIVVTSAMSGITNRLVGICEAIQNNDHISRYKLLKEIFDMHMTCSSELRISTQNRHDLQYRLRPLFIEMRRIADLERLNIADQARMLSFGERCSKFLLNAAFKEAKIESYPIDADRLIYTNDNFLEAYPDFEMTQISAKKILQPLLNQKIVPIVTGFIGSTADNRVTVLGRGGSDYTASILGKVMAAREVWIWTDVDGIYDKDPRKNQDAKIIPLMSYTHADWMAKNGAKVLYSKTVEPLMGSDIVLRVLNTFNPSFEGTRIINFRE